MTNINLPFCLCGCGGRVKKDVNKYIDHHYIRIKNPMKNKETAMKVRLKSLGRKKTESEVQKIKQSCIGINKGSANGMYGKKGELNSCFGKHQSEEHRRKNSESKKGKPPWNLNKKWSKEIKNKISIANTGKTRSDEFKKLKSESMKGEKHFNWRGGCTKEGYCEQWRTKELKESILFRDNNKCQSPQCNKITNKLCIHHINYNKKDCYPDNLITLCFSCNSKANYDRDWWSSFYKEIIKRKI